MKKYLTIALIVLIVLVFLVGYEWLEGKEKETGSPGAPGQDASLSYHSYPFNPDKNPYTKAIAEISLKGVEAGWQTVTVYVKLKGGGWQQLPFSETTKGGAVYDNKAVITDGHVAVQTKKNGKLKGAPAHALGGSPCLVIVQTFAHYHSYKFNPDKNPYTKAIAEISLKGVEAGWQTVTVYVKLKGGRWQQLPFSETTKGGAVYDNMAVITDGHVVIQTKKNGKLKGAPAHALGGSPCLVIVQTLAH